jgi:hypothetical protein
MHKQRSREQRDEFAPRERGLPCEQAHDWAERTAIEQGLPAKVEDVVVIRRVLRLMGLLDADGKPTTTLR